MTDKPSPTIAFWRSWARRVGVVYKAEDTKAGPQGGAQVPPRGDDKDHQALERFEREAARCSRQRLPKPSDVSRRNPLTTQSREL